MLSRLDDPVRRNHNIVVDRQNVNDRVIAIDSNTGNPVRVLHVFSNTAPGGDGSVENPFQTLTQIQAASQNGDMLFAHADSTFNGEGIVLQVAQRLLGEGVSHQFTAQQGTFFLPRATLGTAAPIIQNAPADSVTLANNSEVAGFTMTAAAQSHIAGTNVSGVNINRNTLSNATVAGIRLINASGTANIANNTTSNNTTDGIQVANAIGTLNLSISGNTANGNVNGIALLMSGTSQTTASIFGNTLTNNTNPGINVSGIGQSQLTVLVDQNTIATNANDALRFSATNDARLMTTVSNNQITMGVLGFDGIDFSVANNGFIDATVSGNTITGQMQEGIDLNLNNVGLMVARVTGNTIRSTAAGSQSAVSALVADTSQLFARVENNTISDFDVEGIDLDVVGNADSVFAIIGNTISGSGMFGVDAETNGATPMLDLVLQNNTSGSGYNLLETNGVFRTEDTLVTNTGAVTLGAGIDLFPAGAFPLP